MGNLLGKPSNSTNNINSEDINSEDIKIAIEGFNILQDICIINFDEKGLKYESGFKLNNSTNNKKNYIPEDIQKINLELYSMIIVCTQNSVSGIPLTSSQNNLQTQLKKYFKNNNFELFSKVDGTMMGNRLLRSAAGLSRNVRTRVYINKEKVKVNFDYKNFKTKSYGNKRGSYTNERSSTSNSNIKNKDNDKKEITIDSYQIFRKTAESNIRKIGAGIIYIKLNFLMSNNKYFPVIIVNNNIVQPNTNSSNKPLNKPKNNNVSVNINKLNNIIGEKEGIFYINYCNSQNSKYKILNKNKKENTIKKLNSNNNKLNYKNTTSILSSNQDTILTEKYDSLVNKNDHSELIEKYYEKIYADIPTDTNTNNSKIKTFINNHSLVVRKGLAKYIADQINGESNETKLNDLYKKLYNINAISTLHSGLKKQITGTKMPKEMVELFIQHYPSAAVVTI